jgi:hypothetical protein
MNYIKLYQTIIDNVKKQNRVKNGSFLFESHHIVPKSIGGSNCRDNLVLLTPKEHYICHRLLVEIHRGTENEHKMYYAMWCMINGLGNQKRYATTSKIYDRLRNEMFKIIKVRVSDNRKEINQYDLYGNFITTYKSVKEASLKCGINEKSIQNCARGESKSAGGFNWKYLNSNKDAGVVVFDKSGRKKGGTPWNKGKKMDNVCGKNTKKILQFTTDGKFVKEWDCISNASNTLTINRSAIENCIFGKSKTSGGYIWKYKDSEKEITPIKYDKPGRKSKIKDL